MMRTQHEAHGHDFSAISNLTLPCRACQAKPYPAPDSHSRSRIHNISHLRRRESHQSSRHTKHPSVLARSLVVYRYSVAFSNAWRLSYSKLNLRIDYYDRIGTWSCLIPISLTWQSTVLLLFCPWKIGIHAMITKNHLPSLQALGIPGCALGTNILNCLLFNPRWVSL